MSTCRGQVAAAAIEARRGLSPAAVVRLAASAACSSSACSAWRCSPRPMARLVLFVKQFIDGTFYERNARRVVAGAASARPCCSCCAASATTCRCISRATWGGRSSRRIRARPVPPLPEPAGELLRSQGARATMLSRLTYNVEQVAEAVTKSITSLIRDSLTIVGADRLHVLSQLEAGAVRVGPRAAAVLADPQGHEFVPALQRPHPGIDGRRHARRPRKRSTASASSRCSTRRTQEAQRVRDGQRAQPPQQHEADRGARHQQSGGAVHRLARRSAASCGWRCTRSTNGRMTVGEFMAFLAAMLHDHGAAQAAHGFLRAAAAGPRRRRQRLRGARRAGRGFQERPQARPARRARSNSAT